MKNDPECPANQQKNGSSSYPNSALKDGKYGKSVKFDSSTKSDQPEDENALAINKLIKETLSKMPSLKDTPMDYEKSISYQGKVVAKYCRKCRRFTKGVKMHSSTEHKSRKAGFMSKQRPSPPVVPAVKPPPVTPSVCVPIPAPVSYEFGSLGRASLCEASTVDWQSGAQCEPDDASDCDSVDHRLLAALSSGYPKGYGR